MPSDLPRPAYDAELVPILAQIPPFPKITHELIVAHHMDPTLYGPLPTVDEIIGHRPISHIEYHVPGLNPSDPNVTLSIFTPKSEAPSPRPCIYFIHGGGMIFLNRFVGIDLPIEWVLETNCVLVSVEYRLAPENPHPAPLSDCYAGLCWVSAHAQELGIDPFRLMIGGHSGGGGLAAGVALMARDLEGPKLCAQYLACPMIDDRNITVSSQQYVDEEPWDRGSNIAAWEAVLGSKAGSETEGEVSIYAAPARATDLSGLPPAFIDVGSAEIFRDEGVAYASKLWAAGVQAELHVFPGGFHGFDFMAPKSRLAAQAITLKTEWVKNMLLLKKD